MTRKTSMKKSNLDLDLDKFDVGIPEMDNFKVLSLEELGIGPLPTPEELGIEPLPTLDDLGIDLGLGSGLRR